MMTLFLYYQQAGILQLDLMGLAAYAEYVVLDSYDPALAKEYAPYEAGQLPWRTGNNILTAVTFFPVHHLLGMESAESSVFFTQFFFGALAIVFLYLFLFELFENNFPAVIGALVFGLSAPLFNAVLSKDHGTEFFFVFAAMYFLLNGIKKRSTASLLVSNICLGLSLWMREAALFFPIIYYGFFMQYALSFDRNFHFFSLNKELLTIKNIFVLVIPYTLLTIGALKVYAWLLFVNAVQNLNVSFFTYTKEILVSVWEWHPILYFMCMGLGLFYAGYKKEKTILFFTLICFLFFVLFTKNSTYDLRHLGIYMFFPLSIIICYGISCMLEQWKCWKKYVVFFLAITLCVQVFLPGIPLFEQRKAHVYTAEFAKNIAPFVPDDGIIFMQKDFCLFFLYYAKRQCEGLPTDFFATVDPLLLSEKRVFVLYHAGFGFYSEEEKAAIEQHYTLSVVYTGNFETFHHADLKPQVYEEFLIEVLEK